MKQVEVVTSSSLPGTLMGSSSPIITQTANTQKMAGASAMRVRLGASSRLASTAHPVTPTSAR
jgi:hypothetical protein